MSSQPKSVREAQAGTVAPKVRPRRKPRVDHTEMVRIAETEAAQRAAEQHKMIAIAAYLRAQLRGFEPGHELEDWFAAEREIAEARQGSLA